MPQGIGADLIATLEGWSREDVDAFAAESHHRAAKAWANGYYADCIVPVKDINGLTVLDHDETIRPDTSVEGLAGLKPSFAQIGATRASTTWRWRSTTGSRRSTTSTTPATPRASSTAPRWWRSAPSRSARTSGSPRRRGSCPPPSPAPTRRSCSPVPRPAARKALAKAGLKVEDIDLFEINEAFAAVAMRFMRDMGISDEITNVNGGAIAMGHPLGATGAIILGTLIDELERRDLKRGLATLCVGGGMGIATIVELV